MQKLVYNKIGDGVIEIPLHNGFIVHAISLYNKEESIYKTSLYLRKNDIYILALMGNFYELEFEANFKTINTSILKEVSTLLSNHSFDYYFDYYNLMLKCFEEDDFTPNNKGDK